MHGQDYARNPDSRWGTVRYREGLRPAGAPRGGPARRGLPMLRRRRLCLPTCPVTCTDARKGAPPGPADRPRGLRQGGCRPAHIRHGRCLLRLLAGRVLAGAGLPRRPEEIQNLQAEDMPGGHGRCAQHGHANAQCRSPAVCVVTTCSPASSAPPARASRAGGSSGAPRDPVRARRIHPRIGGCIPAGHLAVSGRARRPRLPSRVAPRHPLDQLPRLPFGEHATTTAGYRPGGAKPPLPAFRPAAEDDDERWRAISPPP